MRRDRLARTSVLSIALFVSAMAQFSCSKNSIDLSDLLGTWTFQNTVNAEFKEIIDGQLTVRLNADSTITVASLTNVNMHGFAFSAEQFRMVIHFAQYPTHLVYNMLWEGEMTGDATLSGKIYFARAADDNNIMDYEKNTEVGSFTANLVSH
jgi:hypothetical protein